MTNPERSKKISRKKLVDRIAILVFSILIAWGAVSLLLHKPTRDLGNGTEENSQPTPKPEPAPVLEKLSIRAFKLLPANSIAGVYVNPACNPVETLNAFQGYKLLKSYLPNMNVEDVIGKLSSETVIAAYLTGSGELTIRGVITCKNPKDVTAQLEALKPFMPNQTTLNLFSRSFYVEVKNTDISFATDENNLDLIPDHLTKAILRLSASPEVQSLCGRTDSGLCAYANLELLHKRLDSIFPAIHNENTFRTLFQAFDLHLCSSAATILAKTESGVKSQFVFNNIRGLGLAGMISEYPVSPTSPTHLPATSLLFTSQTFDVAAFSKSVGGFLTPTNSRGYKNLADKLKENLVNANVSVEILARAFSGELSMAVAYDGLLPEIWISAEITDDSVLTSFLTILQANGYIKEIKRAEGTYYSLTQPLLSLDVSGMKMSIIPAFGRINNHLVLASSLQAVYRAASIAKGKEPALAADADFTSGLTQANNASSFLFARPRKIGSLIQNLAGGTSFDPSILDDSFWSAAALKDLELTITQTSSIPVPILNYLLRPQWIPTLYSVSDDYDSLLTMLISAANWAACKLYYYDYEHLDLTIDTRGKDFKLQADIRAKNLVANSTGFTFLLNPGYKISDITIDGTPATWKIMGPFLSIRSKELIAADQVCQIKIAAEGFPEDMLSYIPRSLLSMFSVYYRPVRDKDLTQLSLTSLFYPSTPGLRDDLWTSTTTVIVPENQTAIANGVLTETEKLEDGAKFVFTDDRPDLTLEINIGFFDRTEDTRGSFKVVNYFQKGVDKDRELIRAYSTDCYEFYANTFGGEFDPEPTLVHLDRTDGISHCLSYIVLYTRQPRVISHELGHLWWGSMVKMNPLESPMWYEGLTEYSNYMFTNYAYGEKDGFKHLQRYFGIWRKYDVPPKVYRDVRMWSERRGILGYAKGFAFFHGLRTALGKEDFSKFLKNLALNKDVFADHTTIWKEATRINAEIDWYLRSMLLGTGVFDLSVDSVEKIAPGQWVVTIKSTGRYYWKGPVTITGKLKNGSIFTKEIAIGGKTELEIELNLGEDNDLEIITVDPFMDIPELIIENNTMSVTYVEEDEEDEE